MQLRIRVGCREVGLSLCECGIDAAARPLQIVPVVVGVIAIDPDIANHLDREADLLFVVRSRERQGHRGVEEVSGQARRIHDDVECVDVSLVSVADVLAIAGENQAAVSGTGIRSPELYRKVVLFFGIDVESEGYRTTVFGAGVERKQSSLTESKATLRDVATLCDQMV
jgi:hypothetical protein